MDQTTDSELILQSIIEKSLALLKRFEQRPGQLLNLIEKWLELSPDYLALLDFFIKNPQDVQNMYQAYFQDTMHLWQEQIKYLVEGKVPPINDKRFIADEWVNNPFFNCLSQHYLLAKEHINALLEHMQHDDKQLIKRVQFFVRQYLDFLSPDNFIQTNPQLMAETLQSNGKNLLLGLQNLLSDIDAGSSRLIITMTDKSAFKVGESLATTPGKVIYQNNLMELIQYTPRTTKVKSVPLLIIPPWINKYYILDLSPHNSLIRWLVDQGITVFVISWVNPDGEYADTGMDDYLNDGPISAINIIQKQLNVKQVNALGFCIGGTLLSILLAYNKAKKINNIRSATFLASMIDFSDPGDISVFIDEQQISKLENHMSNKGYLEGHIMASAFNSLRASDLIWAFFIRNYLHGKPPVPFDILFWNADSTNMPSKMHSQYLRWMYLYNDLIKPGKIRINNTPLDIHDIQIPTFFISTKKDHIAPWKTTYLGFQLMQGKKRFLLGGSGHIAGIIIPPGGEKYGYYKNDVNHINPDDWLATAQYHKGSWWPEWLKWLKKESGRLINPPGFSELPYQAILDAPGSYVGVN
ncbi:MAG: class I poly(R)-hydroxyalkanoic acid synthase [Legionellaceae bacterium]|nr:class I poly(R)-hydroxyalkanoic acid synthase [Legionellaceae bacterium]